MRVPARVRGVSAGLEYVLTGQCVLRCKEEHGDLGFCCRPVRVPTAAAGLFEGLHGYASAGLQRCVQTMRMHGDKQLRSTGYCVRGAGAHRATEGLC